MSLDLVRKSYDRYAPFYDFTFRWLLGIDGREMAANIANTRKGPVLEIGVGTGLTLPYYRRDHQITGIDISSPMLDKAHQRVAKLNLAQVERLEVMDAAEMTFDDASFDVVVAAYVMSVVPEPDKVLAEIERVCRPGADVVIVNHFAAENGMRRLVEKQMSRFSDHLGWHPDFSMKDMLETTRLRLVTVRHIAPFGLFTLLHLKKDD